MACEKGNLPLVQYLIEKGADIEVKDYFENTPLHCASSHGYTDIVKYLLSKGANKNVKNQARLMPYDFAKKDEIRELLDWRKPFHPEDVV